MKLSECHATLIQPKKAKSVSYNIAFEDEIRKIVELKWVPRARNGFVFFTDKPFLHLIPHWEQYWSKPVVTHETLPET